jgi:PhoH-like ATPase
LKNTNFTVTNDKSSFGDLMIYVVDTSVFLSDPKILERFQDKNIVIPLAVLNELEAKRNHPDLGFSARQILRELEKLRISNSLVDPVENIFGGTVRVELNNIDNSGLPFSFREDTNDNRILSVAFNLSKKENVILLTKDLPLRLKASIAGVEASDISDNTSDELKWSGLERLTVEGHIISDLYDHGSVSLPLNVVNNTAVITQSGNSSALAKYQNGNLVLVKEKNIFDVRGKSAEQRFAIDFLMDENIEIVSLGGKAGTGKSLLAIAAGLELVLEKRKHKKVVIFRPLYSVGGQDLGYLPGTAEEKMSPWAAAVFDALEVFCGPNVIEQIIEEELLEVLPLTHIRGRTLSDSYVIIDEAQNLEKMVLLTALSRMGKNSKVVLTHDIAQRDNLHVGKYDGIMSIISSLKGNDIFAHILLQKSERSTIAELVSTLIDT